MLSPVRLFYQCAEPVVSDAEHQYRLNRHGLHNNLRTQLLFETSRLQDLVQSPRVVVTVDAEGDTARCDQYVANQQKVAFLFLAVALASVHHVEGESDPLSREAKEVD